MASEVQSRAERFCYCQLCLGVDLLLDLRSLTLAPPVKERCRYTDGRHAVLCCDTEVPQTEKVFPELVCKVATAVSSSLA